MKFIPSIRKLYERVNQYGEFSDAIIIFDKHPVEFKYEKRTEPKPPNFHEIEARQAKFRCTLQIDLWIVKLRFKWGTEFKDVSIGADGKLII